MSTVATAPLSRSATLSFTPAHVWHDAEVNVTTSQSASGRAKSWRSSWAGTVHDDWVGASGLRRCRTTATTIAMATTTRVMRTRSTPATYPARPTLGDSGP